MPGPLTGLTVVELAGIGPGPFASMLLADLGARVIKVDRSATAQPERPAWPNFDLLARNRETIGVDLKNPEGVEVVLRLVENADVLIEGFRPGVAERLGLGPDDCLERNPELVYGRMTGWGQDGPRAQLAGHDINYISIAGVLGSIGRVDERPQPPLNLVGDFGGGAMYLIMGILAALWERQTSGKGQVVDAAMVDGAASLMTIFYSLSLSGMAPGRGKGLLDTGAPFHEVYETADGRFLGLGSIEPQFYAELLQLLEIDPTSLPGQMDMSQWPAMKERFAEVIKTKTRDEWATIFETSDACVAPVLDLHEAVDDPHMVARGTFVEVDGFKQPAPAPRFSRTPAAVPVAPAHPGEHTRSVLASMGLSEDQIEALFQSGAVAGR